MNDHAYVPPNHHENDHAYILYGLPNDYARAYDLYEMQQYHHDCVRFYGDGDRDAHDRDYIDVVCLIYVHVLSAHATTTKNSK